MQFSRPNWKELKKHRLSILLTCVVVMAIGVVHTVWVAPAMQSTRDISAHLEQQRELIAKYQEKLAKSQGLKNELEQKEQELQQLQAGLFHGNDPYQLAAALAEPFSEGSQEVSIKSYQVVSSKEYGLYQEVKLKFSFTTSIQGLYQFLESLEKNPSAVFVEDLNIRSLRRRKGSDLMVNLVLLALMEKGGKS
jgi:Tfp pilus assembly protein PilO